MFDYLVRRIFAMIPTLFGITVVVFGIINLAPGSPVDQKIQQLRFGGMDTSNAGVGGANSRDSVVSNEVIEALKKQYGFDKPIHVRYWIWLKNLSRLDFGESFTYEEPVMDVIVSKFPVSIQFGVASLFLSYIVCIILGVAKAVKNGSIFDTLTSSTLFAAYSIPGYMLGVLLIVFFAGGQFFEWFPLGELYSDDYDDFSFLEQVGDRIWHFVLPLISYMIGSFTVLTVLMKNSLLDEISKEYIRTARAKGLSEKMVYFKHGLRNALIPIVTGIGSFLSVFFAGSLLIEVIFQLDGMGLLGYQAVLERDYNVLMGLIFVQSVLMLFGNLISDIAYVIVDPRIDFK